MKQINDNVFLDTNIIIYLYSIDEINKRNQAETIINNFENIIISTQVINEFINVMHRKVKLKPLALEKIINELFDNFTVINIAKSTIEKAIYLIDKFNYSYFDSLIIASALESNCIILYTEDLHSNHNILNSIKIENPFR